MHLTAPPLPHRAFLTEQPWQFAFGHVFWPTGEIMLDGPELPEDEIGYWRCDIARGDRLSWTAQVYRLFGFPAENHFMRDDALGRYSDGSRSVLERVRTFSITKGCGFMLDAKMRPNGHGARGLRILSVPVIRDGRVVAIHGLKRAL